MLAKLLVKLFMKHFCLLKLSKMSNGKIDLSFYTQQANFIFPSSPITSCIKLKESCDREIKILEILIIEKSTDTSFFSCSKQSEHVSKLECSGWIILDYSTKMK